MFFEKLQRLSPFGETACPDRNVSGGRGLYFNLYNMNGRIYDPLVGRFLSADPVISDGGNTQSYNRYSYVLNNPLRYTDPSGYTYKPTYWDEAIGGGGVPVRTYGRFDFAANSVWNNWTGGSNYSYDQNHNRYLDQLGNVVAYQEVHNNYVVPNSSVDRLYTHISTLAGIYSTGTMIDGFKLNGTLYELDHPVPYNQIYAAQGQGGESNFLNTSNTINTFAGAAAIATDKVLTGTRLGSNIGYSLAYKGIGNATKYIQPVGVGTSIVGAGIGFYKFFGTENKTWGVYGQLGVSLLSSGLTLSGVTAPVGIGIGVIDTFGGFNGFYNYLDNQQHFYNSTGGLLVPVNGIPSYFQLNRK